MNLTTRFRFLIALLLLILIVTPASGQKSDVRRQKSDLGPLTADLCIAALVGEAGGEGERGMLAVAGAIRNRGHLRGVYGVHNPSIASAPAHVWTSARRAWFASATNDITHGATHWENVQQFGVPKWAKAMTRTATIGRHTFFR